MRGGEGRVKTCLLEVDRRRIGPRQQYRSVHLGRVEGPVADAHHCDRPFGQNLVQHLTSRKDKELG